MTETGLPQILLTPGPTQVPPDVLQAISQPVIHHRTAAFREIFSELGTLLQHVFCTDHPVLTLAGSGTTAFEAAAVSLACPGQRAVTCANGKFSERWQDLYATYGVEQERVDVPWGEAIDPARVEEALARSGATVVTLVHSETSTATASDVRSIAEIVHRHDALLIVDGITSVAALPLEMDAWSVDCVVCGSQKALMLPPGLGFVALGPRALHRLGAVDGLPAFHLDLRRWLSAYRKGDVPYTPPVNLIRGQRVALQRVVDQGLEQVWKDTSQRASATRAALATMGLALISVAPSDSVTGAFYPTVGDGVIDDGVFRSVLRDHHGIHIAGGQSGRLGDLARRAFRISHMGFIDAAQTRQGLEAIETEFIAAGAAIQAGVALPAFDAVMGEGNA